MKIRLELAKPLEPRCEHERDFQLIMNATMPSAKVETLARLHNIPEFQVREKLQVLVNLGILRVRFV